MDLIRRARFQRRSRVEESSRVPADMAVTGPARQRQSRGIRPDPHETLRDDLESVMTVETLTGPGETETEDDTIEVLRPELEDGPTQVRGTGDLASDASFRMFLSATARARPARRFPAVTTAASSVRDPGDKPSADPLSLLEAIMDGLDVTKEDGGEGRRGRRKEGGGTKMWTPLHYAAQKGSTMHCRTLVQHGADIEARTESGWTPLFYAAQDGHLDICRILLENGAKIDVSSYDHYRTPMIVAARHGHLEVVKMFVEKGADVNFPVTPTGKHEGSPLHYSVMGRKVEVTEYLIDHGATVDILDEQLKTPLCIAALNRSIDLMRLLIKHGANVRVHDYRKWTPLHLVVQHDRPDTMEAAGLLLDAGADVNAIDEDGDTALMTNSYTGRVDVMELLLRHGANMDWINNKGIPAIFLYAGKGHLDGLDLLLSRGANPHYVTAGTGMTALHLAASRQDPSVVLRLLKAGVDPYVVDEDGLTSLHVASQNDNEEVLVAMLNHGVKP